MDTATFERETVRNQRAYESLRDQIRREHAGLYVALGEGRILAVAATYDQATAAVRKLPTVPEYFLVFAAEDEPVFEPFYDYGITS